MFNKLIIMILLIVSITCLLASEKITVTFATGEWEPFTSETMPNKGIATEFIEAICKEAGIIPTFEFFPWSRAELNVKNGTVFAAFPYAITEERKLDFNFSDTIFYGINALFYIESNAKITKEAHNFKSLKDLNQYTFGVIRGSFLENEFKANNITYYPANSIEEAFRMLNAGRTDFVIENQTAGYYSINRIFPNDSKKFKVLDKHFGESTSNAILVSRTYPNSDKILERFNQGLAKIKVNGTYDALVKKHNMGK